MKKRTLTGARAVRCLFAGNPIPGEPRRSPMKYQKRYSITVGIEDILATLRKKVLLLKQSRESRAVSAALHRAYPFVGSNYRGGNPLPRPHFHGLPSGRRLLPLDFSLEREIRYAAPQAKNTSGQLSADDRSHYDRSSSSGPARGAFLTNPRARRFRRRP